MPRHKRSAPLFVGRRRYLKLRREYEELERHYRALAENHDRLLEPASADQPARHVPSWAVTEESPVITTAGMDTAKADALVRRWGMAGSPAGSWGVNRGTTG